MNKKKQKNNDWDELGDFNDLLTSASDFNETPLLNHKPSKKQRTHKKKLVEQKQSFQVQEKQCVLPEREEVEPEKVKGKTRRRSALFEDGKTNPETKVLGYTERNKRLSGESSVAEESEYSDGGEVIKKEFNRLFAKGVSLLGIREHSVMEMTNKLNDRSEFEDIVFEVIDELLENNYLSNERFTESYVRSRRNKGFGPVKIRAELKTKGIGSRLIAEKLLSESPEWIDVAREQFDKKYRAVRAENYKEWTKRARFMQSRGFTMEHIQAVLPSADFY